MSVNDEILADRRKTWHGVGRLLFWGTIHALVLVLITVLFAINGPTATMWAVALILFFGNCAITAAFVLLRR